MTTPTASILSLRTIWERDIVSREGADTALVVNITAASDAPRVPAGPLLISPSRWIAPAP
ncbi:MAG TPA: hypothetical protein VGR08_12480 [Thermomicrobiales bacterium]|nr:hypothetical protein [Thermomicrobiales bacterium]